MTDDELRSILQRLLDHRPVGIASHALIVAGDTGAWVDTSFFDEDRAAAARMRSAVARLRPSGAPEAQATAMLRCLWPEANPTHVAPVTRADAIDALRFILVMQLYFGYPWPYPDFGPLLDAIGRDGLWAVSTSPTSPKCSGEMFERILLGHAGDRVSLFVQATTTL